MKIGNSIKNLFWPGLLLHYYKSITMTNHCDGSVPPPMSFEQWTAMLEPSINSDAIVKNLDWEVRKLAQEKARLEQLDTSKEAYNKYLGGLALGSEELRFVKPDSFPIWKSKVEQRNQLEILDLNEKIRQHNITLSQEKAAARAACVDRDLAYERTWRGLPETISLEDKMGVMKQIFPSMEDFYRDLAVKFIASYRATHPVQSFYLQADINQSVIEDLSKAEVSAECLDTIFNGLSSIIVAGIPVQGKISGAILEVLGGIALDNVNVKGLTVERYKKALAESFESQRSTIEMAADGDPLKLKTMYQKLNVALSTIMDAPKTSPLVRGIIQNILDRNDIVELKQLEHMRATVDSKVFEEMSIKFDGKLNQDIIEHLKKFYEQTPDGFHAYHNKIKKQSQDENKLQEEKLIKIMRETGFTACETLGEIAKIAKLPELAKTAQLGTLTLKLTQQLGVITDINKMSDILAQNGENIALILANPALASVNIATQILGLFMGGSGPSFEEIMLEQLQKISTQINNLHEDMLKQFGQVHEHLRVLHESILHSSAGLEILITSQVNGFRSDAITHLKRIEGNVEHLRRIVSIGIYEQLIQDLTNLCTEVDARIKGHGTINEKDAVQAVAHKLEHSWILNQAAAQGLTGRSGFIEGNNSKAHEIDEKRLPYNYEGLSNNLGYTAAIARETGLDLSQIADGVAKVDYTKIVNIEIFDLAVTQYLKLRRMFPTYVQDDEKGSEFLKIQEFVNHTLNFIRKIQRSKDLFNNLLANYQQAVAEVNAAIEMQINHANHVYGIELRCSEIDLRYNLEELIQKFTGKFPRNTKIINLEPGRRSLRSANLSPVTLPELDLHDFPAYNSFKLPPEMLMAESFKIGEIHCTYTAIFGGSLREHGRGDYLVSWTGKSPLNIQEYEYTPMKGHSYLRYIIKFEIKDTCTFSVTLEKHAPPELFGNELLDGNKKRLGSTDLTPVQIRIHANDETKLNDSLTALRSSITTKILQKRKELIVQSLLQGDNGKFIDAVRHLDSAKRRLLTFSILSGMPDQLNIKFSILPSSRDIYERLRQYLKSADMDTLYWDSPNNDTIAIINQSCMQAIDAGIFNSVLEQRIMSISNLISLTRTMYINYKDHENVMYKTSEEKARELLGFGIVDLGSKFPENPNYGALIKAIIDNDKYEVIEILQSDTKIQLDRGLNIKRILPIHLAAYLGNSEIVTEFLNKNLDVINKGSANGFTALMYAVLSGNLDTVRHICERGADLSLSNRDGKTAVQLAQEYGYDSIYEYMLRADSIAKLKIKPKL